MFVAPGTPGRGYFALSKPMALLVLATAAAALAPRVAGPEVNLSSGSLNQGISIQVPPFHGIEPRLSLGYSSDGGNGLLGVGWGLSGISRIERTGPGGRGAPRFNSTDGFVLDGQPLVPCAQGSVSPSCTTGGTARSKKAT